MKNEGTENTKLLLTSAGIISILLGVLPLAGFQLLGKYGYPELIRESPKVILESIYQARNVIPYLYYAGVGGAGLCVIFLSILMGIILNNAGEKTLSELGKYCGIINGLCLYGGILRWTFLFPKLAEFRALGTYDTETIDLVFKSFNTYVGDTIAEHVGFTFMFLWVLFFSIALIKTKVITKWLGFSGIGLCLLVLYGNLEFFGVPGAFIANRLAAELVAVWAMLLGINLILKRNTAFSDKP